MQDEAKARMQDEADVQARAEAEAAEWAEGGTVDAADTLAELAHSTKLEIMESDGTYRTIAALSDLPESSQPKQGAAVVVEGDTIHMRTANGGTVTFLVDRERVKQTWQEVQRRVNLLTHTGVPVFQYRFTILMDNVTCWGDKATQDLAGQIQAALDGYGPGVPFANLKAILRAAAAKQWQEFVAAAMEKRGGK